MPYPEVAQTARMRLRRLRDEDEKEMAAIWGDAAVWRALRPGHAFDPEHFRARHAHHAQHWRDFGFGLWLAECPPGAPAIGWIGASHPLFIPELAGEVEIGWTLRGRWWGRGLASEGAVAAVDAVFGNLDVERVVSLIAPANARSIAVAERLGMVHEGNVRHPAIRADVAVYALSRPG